MSREQRKSPLHAGFFFALRYNTFHKTPKNLSLMS